MWFKQILEEKIKFIEKYGYEPNTFLVNLADCKGLETEIIDRLKYIRDTVVGEPLGSYLLGLKVIKTTEIENFKIALVL